MLIVMQTAMRIGAIALGLVAGQAVADDGRIPVIVELFTSEGCSSCPPADETLAKLERSQPVRNAQVIALEEHVDYWNQMGWPDRFASPLFRARQNEYARTFKTENIYTPQMIVGGQAEFVGDDMARAVREISTAATAPMYTLRLLREQDAGGTNLSVFVKNMRPGKPPANADVYLAITENRLTSNVAGGENAGKTLRHAAVVRSFGVIGTIEPHAFNEVGVRSTLQLPRGLAAGESARGCVHSGPRHSPHSMAPERSICGNRFFGIKQCCKLFSQAGERAMNRAIGVAFVLTASLGSLEAAANSVRTPVIVELFTSEGCSSCPSADTLLARLEKAQPVAGAQIIALEEHVDYWNQLGWTDPFSSPQFSRRQNDYAQALHVDGDYTPQAVVNGRAEFVGSDGKRSMQEIARAASGQPAYSIQLVPAGGHLSITVTRTLDGKAEPADVVLAITEGQLSSQVRKGENSGKLLQHAPVVRSLTVVGSVSNSATLALQPALQLEPAWKRENLRAVVFLQNRGSRRITAAATIDLP